MPRARGGTLYPATVAKFKFTA
eukprot:SAG31_NODE_16736_length_698_cov_0.896494_2_plen_21_part_01